MLKILMKQLHKLKVLFVRPQVKRRNRFMRSFASAKLARRMQYRTRKAASHRVRRTRAQS